MGTTPCRFVLSSLVALTGCTSGPSTSTPSDVGGSAVEESANETPPGTRLFTDVRGEPIEVPAEPQRIVAIHDSNGGVQVLELGGELLGFPTRGGQISPEIADRHDLAAVTLVGDTYEPDVEVIAGLEPDLIVGEGYAGDGMNAFMGEGIEDALQQIAPTVYIDVFRPVEEVMADFAELLGGDAVQRYGQLRTEYADSLDGYHDQLTGSDGLSAVCVQHKADSAIDLWGANALPVTATLTRLGVRQPPITEAADTEENGGYLGGVSLEQIPELSADVIFVERAQGTEHSDDYSDNPLWQGLPAVQAEQVVNTDATWYGTTFGVYQDVLDIVGPALVDADPAVVTEDWETTGS